MVAATLETTQLESKIQQSICNFARSKGWVPVKLQSIARKGWPDLAILGDGWTLFLEVKKPNGVVAPSQKALISRMLRGGLNVYVVRSVQGAKVLLMAQTPPLE